MNEQEYDAILSKASKIDDFIERWEDHKEDILNKISIHASYVASLLVEKLPPLEGVKYTHSFKLYQINKTHNFYIYHKGIYLNKKEQRVDVYAWSNFDKDASFLYFSVPYNIFFASDLEIQIAECLRIEKEKQFVSDQEKIRLKEKKDRSNYLRLKEKFEMGN